jgi:hypothetical protein
MEEGRPDLPELPIFADFISHMESDRVIPDAMPPAPPEDLPSGDAPAETQGEAPALQLAATHHEWFGGGDKEPPDSEPFMQRKPPVSFRKAEPDASERDKTVEEAGQTDLPLQVPSPVGAPAAVAEVGAPLPVAETTAQTTDVGKPSSAIADHATPPVVPAAMPPHIAGDRTRQQTQLHGLPGWFPGQHPDQGKAARYTVKPNDADPFAAAPALTSPQVRNNRVPSSSASRAATSAAAARAARRGRFVSANMQASLSALESVLSRESLGGNADGPMKAAEDASARGPQQQPAIKNDGMTSVWQETQFAPVPSQSPALQIAQRITHEMQVGGQNMPQPDAPAEARKQPVRVVHIQLSPPQLGPMTIRLSMQNDGLMIQLETANRETAHLINRDRDGLSGMLRAAGYCVDGLDVQVTATERGAPVQAAGQGDGINQAAGQQQGQSSNPGNQDATTPEGHSRAGVYL